MASEEIPIDWSKIKFFEPDEFIRPDRLRNKTILLLDQIREEIGKPIIITSSLRTLSVNKAINGAENSAHLIQSDGFYSGIDFTIAGGIDDRNRRIYYEVIYKYFHRVGLYSNHFHVDIENRPPALWFKETP